MFTNGPGDRGSIPGQVIQTWGKKANKQQRYLMSPCFTHSIIRYRSRVKLINPGKGVAPSLTPRCSSYWKESLRVTLDYDYQPLTFYIPSINNSDLRLKIYKFSHSKIILNIWDLFDPGTLKRVLPLQINVDLGVMNSWTRATRLDAV